MRAMLFVTWLALKEEQLHVSSPVKSFNVSFLLGSKLFPFGLCGTTGFIELDTCLPVLMTDQAFFFHKNLFIFCFVVISVVVG